MRTEARDHRAPDGATLQVHRWLPDGEPRLLVLLVHGMGEHAARYAPLGARLCEAGHALVAPDLRGHGAALAPDQLGKLGPGGWEGLVDDAVRILEEERRAAGDPPCVLMGHSMGSFAAQQIAIERRPALTGLVLSGSTWMSSGARLVALWLARLESWRLGPDVHSPVLQRALFGRSNRAFEPARTAYDWLSRDPEQVDRYASDPACGFVVASGGVAAMLSAIGRFQRPAALRALPRDLPLYVFSGSRDPVSGTRGFEALVRAYGRAGLERLSARLYPEGRHEMLNELNRQEVENDLLEWLDGVQDSR